MENKKVLITGATGGIGSEIARAFARQGAIVGIHYNSSEDKGKALSREINNLGGYSVPLWADLTKENSRYILIGDFVNYYGAIDVLVNNAGAIYGNENFLSLEEEDYDKTMDLNAKAVFFLSKNAFRFMRHQTSGKIINISSVACKYGGSEQSMHYAAAKAAVESMTLGMARAGAKHNILVNAIRCGFIDTGFHEKIGRTAEDIEKRIAMIPLKRSGKAEDIANMVLFLAGSSGDFVTGQVITMAGGD